LSWDWGNNPMVMVWLIGVWFIEERLATDITATPPAVALQLTVV
jgi:hypothetical protein